MIDLTGRKFGRLTVIERAEGFRGGVVVWKCMCDCGTECYVPGANMKKGSTKSCGCLRREKAPANGRLREIRTKKGVKA